MLGWLQVILIGVILNSFSTRVYALGKPVVTGSITRDTTINYFDFSIKITDVAKADLTPKEKDLLKDRIRIWLVDLASGTSDFVAFEGDTQSAAVPFYVSSVADLVKTPTTTSLVDFTYSLRITATNPSYLSLKKLLDDKGGGKSVKMKVQYFEDGTMQSENTDATISVSSAIVKSNPTGLSVSSTHKALVAKWTPITSATWTEASVTSVPTAITIVTFDKTTLHTNLPAYIYDSSKTSDSAASDGVCTFNSQFEDGASCITCSDANAYLNPTGLEELKSQGIFAQTTSVSTGESSVAGLENGKAYAIAMFYQPGGLQQSICLSGTPEPNTSYSELNGEKEASLSDPKCFIATAAYGSALHKNLKPLRWFRDRVLLKTKTGNAFVMWYYEHGPKAANVVGAYPALQTMVQAILWMPVILLTGWMAIAGSDPNLPSTPMLATTLSILFAAVYLYRKYRKDA